MNAIRVLVVDDEGELAHTVVERLGIRGFEAHAVTSGADALARIAENEYDVVLLDLKMPGLGGLEVIDRIREQKPDLPVILVTGHGSVEAAEEGMRAGAHRYVMKPVSIETLTELIREAAES
ncbi:MAG: response regulator [bacterium]